MCEETKNYLWALQDILGRGATSQVYKAYNKSTGELVAAKVYQVSSNSRSIQGDGKVNQNKDYRPILERELDILKSADHENIVRYITLEGVISSDSPQSSDNREALLIEYCNGGSLLNVLELPENRYGLPEDDFMLVFRHLTNALKYLHDKNTVRKKTNKTDDYFLFYFYVIYLDSSRY
jgi:inhibitor of nuclear factor kappa-B kinase subunit epsilon